MKMVFTRIAVLGLLAFAPAFVQAQNLLTNGNLNSTVPGDYFDLPAGWALATDPNSLGPEPPIRFPAFQAEYADRTDPDAAGTLGLVFNSSEGDFPGFPDVIFVDGHLSQDVPATPGQKYQMRGWAYFEGGYAGGVETIATGTGTTREGLPSLTDTFFALEFLDVGDNVLPGSIEIELHEDAGQDNTRVETPLFRRNWAQHVLTAVAPAGTVEVRVRASMVDGEFNIDMPHQAAWVDDFSLQAIPEPATWLLGLLGLTFAGVIRRAR